MTILQSPIKNSFVRIAQGNKNSSIELQLLKKQFIKTEKLLKKNVKDLQLIKLPSKARAKDLEGINYSGGGGSPLGNALMSGFGSAAGGLLGGGLDLFGNKAKKEGAEQLAKSGGKVVAKEGTEKIATKGAAKVIGKKIPLIGLGFGAAFALGRAKEGDWLGAVGELASGAASTIPGLGTAASLGIDAALLGRDIKKDMDNSQNENGSDNQEEKSIEEKLKARREQSIEAQRRAVQKGKYPALVKFELAVDMFGKFMKNFDSSSSADIGPGTATDTTGGDPDQMNPAGDSGDYPGFDNVERVAPYVTGFVSTYPGAQYGASRNGGRVHLGQDIDGQKAGDPVLSVMKGTVVEVGKGFAWQKGGGSSQTIGIKHEDGSMTRYVHVMANVGVGDEVKTGQKIGTVSPADKASSEGFPHLHFELYAPGGGAIDPRPFLKSAPVGKPAVAPISGNAKLDAKATVDKFGAIDLESTPSVTVGDAVAKGFVKKGENSLIKSDANTADVLNMLQSKVDLKGKLLRLSTGAMNSNVVGDSNRVMTEESLKNNKEYQDIIKQIEYAKSQGAVGVQLMGVANEGHLNTRTNAMLERLASQYPEFVQFLGGFKGVNKVSDYVKPNNNSIVDTINNFLGRKDDRQILPNFGVYRRKADELLAPPRPKPDQLQSSKRNYGSEMAAYPEYNKNNGGTVIMMPVASGESSKRQVMPVPVGGGDGGSSSPMMVASSRSSVVNSVMQQIFLTQLINT